MNASARLAETCQWLTSLTWPQFDGLNSKSTFYLSSMFFWLEWFQIISLSACFNHWHLLDGNSFCILSCMTLTRRHAVCSNRAPRRTCSALYSWWTHETCTVCIGSLIYWEITCEKCELVTSCSQTLIMEHISVFPSWENNIILPVVCLTGCWSWQKHIQGPPQSVCVSVWDAFVISSSVVCGGSGTGVTHLLQHTCGRHMHRLIQTHRRLNSAYFCQSQPVTLQLLPTSPLLCISPQFLSFLFFLFTIHFHHLYCPSPKSPPFPIMCV